MMCRRFLGRLSLLFALVGVCMAQVKILQSNDDGWAVANVRALNTALNGAGFNVVLSAPAENESGTGSSDATPTTVGSSGCQFSSCPPNSPATGSDPDDARLNYVNSFPVTSVRIGIQTTGPLFFGGTVPDLVVTGPNVGTNLGSGVLTSGTVGAACEGAKEGIPSIAFSGSGGSQVSYTTLDTPSASTTTANVFADLSTTFIQALLDGTSSGQGEAILPPGIILNVNFHGASGSCDEAESYTFVLTRVNAAASGAAADVETCGSDRLLTESHVVGLGGCFASVSVMNATSKGDVDAALQGEVLGRLEGFLGCT